MREANDTKWGWAKHEDEKPEDKTEQLEMLYKIFMGMEKSDSREEDRKEEKREEDNERLDLIVYNRN